MTNLQRHFNAIEKNLFGFPLNLNDAFHSNKNQYPFYDILQDTDGINVVLNVALAGWKKEEIKVETKKNEIVITGVNERTESPTGQTYIHRGISLKDFKKKFLMGDNVVVDDAKFEDGVLSVKMHQIVREEHMPRVLEL